MAPGAERKPGIETDVDGVGIRGRVPRRHDPQARGDPDGPELRLGAAYPIDIPHRFDGVVRRGREPRVRRGGGEERRKVGARGEERADPRPPPAGRPGTRLVEDRLFRRRAGEGVLEICGRRPMRKEGIGQRIRVVRVDVDDQCEPGQSG
jgi:hypothetical protein